MRESGMPRDIGPFQFEILASLQAHPGDAYGLTIRDRVKERSGREPSIGAIYTALERLESMGLVSSWWGEPTEERGGRRKRLYRIEASGELAARRFEARFAAALGASAASAAGFVTQVRWRLQTRLSRLADRLAPVWG
jgi:PadR family transcriptional regulator PadR